MTRGVAHLTTSDCVIVVSRCAPRPVTASVAGPDALNASATVRGNVRRSRVQTASSAVGTESSGTMVATSPATVTSAPAGRVQEELPKVRTTTRNAAPAPTVSGTVTTSVPVPVAPMNPGRTVHSHSTGTVLSGSTGDEHWTPARSARPPRSPGTDRGGVIVVPGRDERVQDDRLYEEDTSPRPSRSHSCSVAVQPMGGVLRNAREQRDRMIVR